MLKLSEFNKLSQESKNENSKSFDIATGWIYDKHFKNTSVRFGDDEKIKEKMKKYMDYWIYDKEPKNNKEGFKSKFYYKLFFQTQDFNQALSSSFKVTKYTYEKLFNKKVERTEPFVGDYYNAEEYCLQNPFPKPNTFENSKILEFGPGYGRNISTWSELSKDLVYCGVDAQREQYIFQNYFYNSMDMKLFEYFKNPKEFKITGTPGIYHLPTWKMNLLPSDFFDKIICTFVLGELTEKLLKIVLKEFSRVLKHRGGLYIRDHPKRFNGNSSFDKILRKNFVLEFRPYLQDGEEMHGIPYLYAKKSANIDIEKFSPLKKLKKFFK